MKLLALNVGKNLHDVTKKSETIQDTNERCLSHSMLQINIAICHVSNRLLY